MSRVTSDFSVESDRVRRAVERGVKLGVGQILLEIGARADELVPFDTGTLSRSQTTDVETVGKNIIGEIGYGGPPPPTPSSSTKTSHCRTRRSRRAATRSHLARAEARSIWSSRHGRSARRPSGSSLNRCSKRRRSADGLPR